MTENNDPLSSLGSARQRPRRGADLDAIFSEIDRSGKARSDKSDRLSALHSLVSEVEEKPPEPVTPVETTGPVPVTPVVEEEAVVNLPEGLEQYLSPDLWRRLMTNPNRHGVLINALERLRSVQYQLSTYLPANLVQEKMRRPVPGLVSGQMLNGSLLFADVSGFTALSERLAVFGPEGAERLTNLMNRYFSSMLQILSWSGGVLVKFAGDATLVYFAEQEGGEHARWAVRAAARMLRAIQAYSNLETPAGTVSLKMKIGVATGSFLAASIGSEKRMEYAVMGEAVSQAMKAEGLASPGQIVANPVTVKALGDDFTIQEARQGYSLVQTAAEENLDDFEVNAEKRRARGAIPWNATPQVLAVQMEVAMRQIQSLRAYLPEELVERMVTHAAQRKMDSDYRPTTVMFVNFKGPENWLQTWGESGVSRLTTILSGYFSTMQATIHRFGGIVSRIDPYSSGTKMLVLFGAPVTHEDDPQRAVSAGLAMNQELIQLNERWRQRFARYLPEGFDGDLIVQRIGITHGLAFAGQVGSSTRREYTVMGDDVNLAARMMGAADLDQVLVNDSIQTAAGDFFIFSPMHPIRVKGKSKPIPIFQVDGPRDDTLLIRIRNRELLVGREVELSVLNEALASVKAGQGGLVSVEGATGMGKSHLVDTALSAWVSSDLHLVAHVCPSYQAEQNFAAWTGVLHSLAGMTPIDGPYEMRVKFEKLLEGTLLPGGVAAQLASLLGAPLQMPDLPDVEEQPRDEEEEAEDADLNKENIMQGRRRRRSGNQTLLRNLEQPTQARSHSLTGEHMYLALKEILIVQARSAPLVVFFEDAHWMDAPSRALLDKLEPELKKGAVLVIIAQRSDDTVTAAEKEKNFMAARENQVQPPGRVIALEALSQADTARLVAHILVSDVAPVIHEQSHGSPFFVEEITRWLKRSQKIGAEELKKVLQSSDFLQKLVLSNLESYTELQRDVIRAAAVAGDEFRFGEVQALLPGVDPVTLINQMRSLVKGRLITLTEAGIDARYVFTQPYIRQVLYRNQPVERRKELHARMAQHLAGNAAKRQDVQSRMASLMGYDQRSNPAQDAERLAGHYQQAEMWREAAAAWLKAAAELRKQGTPATSLVADCQAAIASLENLKERSGLESLFQEAWQGLGDAAMTALDHALAVDHYQKAAGMSVSPELAARLALALVALGRVNEARQGLEDALRGVDSPGLLATMTQAWLLSRERHADAPAWLDRAGQSLRVGEAQPAASALLTLLEGNLEPARMVYASQNNPIGLGWTTILLGEQYLAEGDDREAASMLQRAERAFGNDALGQACKARAAYASAAAAQAAGEPQKVEAALKQSLEHLVPAPALIRKEGREIIQQAQQSKDAWAIQPWPILADWVISSLLFQL